MIKKVYFPLLGILIFLCVLLTGCGCKHEWQDAACEAPKTCTKCSQTRGEALGHKWADATCEIPKTCSVCQKTEGNHIGIQLFKSELCKPLFGTWSGNISIPSTYFELPSLSGGFNFKIIFTFHDDGDYEATAILTNKDTVVGHLWAHYVNAFYIPAALAQNLTKK